MSASILDPRMINGSIPFNISQGTFTSLTATNILTTQLESTNTTTTNANNTNTVTDTALANSLTATNAVVTTLSTGNVNSSNLTIYGNVITNISVLSANTDIILDDTYNSKIVHIDTTTTPSVTLSLPNTISNGFNVSIVNAGTGTVTISAPDGFNAPGTTNSTSYTGMFVYKVNNQFFGVGVFE